MLIAAKQHLIDRGSGKLEGVEDLAQRQARRNFQNFTVTYLYVLAVQSTTPRS